MTVYIQVFVYRHTNMKTTRLQIRQDCKFAINAEWTWSGGTLITSRILKCYICSYRVSWSVSTCESSGNLRLLSNTSCVDCGSLVSELNAGGASVSRGCTGIIPLRWAGRYECKLTPPQTRQQREIVWGTDLHYNTQNAWDISV